MEKMTAVEWLYEVFYGTETFNQKEVLEQAKKMEKEQQGYSKADVIKACEMGEINHHDVKHIISYLDEAKQFNETYGGNK